MENEQLAWRSDAVGISEIAKAARKEKGKVALVLLVSPSDGKDCCAANYERTLFRSPRLVKYARGGAVPFRFNRDHGIGRELYASFELDSKKPSVLALDLDGTLLYKTQRCTEPRDCLKGLAVARAISARKQAYAPKVEERLSKARKLINDRDYKKALESLSRINESYLTATLKKKVARYHSKVFSDGKSRLRTARKYEKNGRLDSAERIYAEVARSFSRVKKLKDVARKGYVRVRQAQRESST